MNGIPRVAALAAVPAMLAGFAAAAPAQSVLERTPNLEGGWVGVPGQIHFNFLHRFDMTSAPTRKVLVSPTFLLAAPLPARTLAGVRFSTSSGVVPGIPNEWEFLGRIAPLAERHGAPVDVTVQVGYNEAARSADAELTVARRIGPLRLVGAGRAFSDGYASGEARFALGGGGALRISPSVALAGDFVALLERYPEEDPAWGAALQLAIPYSPHTLSLQATNVNTGSLQGSSRGSGRTRYGFEFTVPVTLARYISRPPPPPPDREPVIADANDAETNGAETVRAEIRDFEYVPARIEVPVGTTVIWANTGAVEHTVTEDEGRWDSGTIDPGKEWRRRFDEPGTYSFHCAPHPFMRGVIVVRATAS